MNTPAQIKKKLQAFSDDIPEILLILGSGWNKVIEEFEIEKRISYSDWLGVEPSVPGHEGELIIGSRDGVRVACMAGRIHLYEGYSAQEVTTPIKVLIEAGVKKCVITAACGAINPLYKVGDFVIMSDVLTLFMSFDSPLQGAHFVDMSQLFNPHTRQEARKVCANNDIPYQQGVYCFYKGPSYETPTDKMALRVLGADVVGMSTVPEAIIARSLGAEVLGLGFVTNLAFVKHDHKDVVAQAQRASGQMVKLLLGVSKSLSAS